MENHANEQKLLQLIINMQPVEFLGLANLLGVKVMEQGEDEKAVPRTFADVLEEVLAKFSKQNRQRKREILKLVQKANSVKN